MAREVFRARLVHDVGAEVERVEQPRAHHGVVDDDDGGAVGGVCGRGDARDVDDLDERVGRGLEEHHGGLVVENRGDAGDVGGVDVVHDNAAVGGEVFEEAVCAAVEVVARDDFVAGLQQSRNHVERAHAGGDDERAVRGHDFGQMALEMRAGRVAGACVVEFATAGAGGLFECRGLWGGGK